MNDYIKLLLYLMITFFLFFFYDFKKFLLILIITFFLFFFFDYIKLLLILIITLIFSNAQGYEHCTIQKVLDGDTFICNNKTIRLSKIDAPEINQEFGIESKFHLISLLKGKEIFLTEIKKDQYGRNLAIVWAGEKEINLEMVAEGYAWNYKKYNSDKNYVYAENIARKNNWGLWQIKKPVEPWTFRKNEKQIMQ